jgi:hypothetical protein
MRLFENSRRSFIGLIVLYLLAWVAVIAIFSLYNFCSYFNVLYSFITVLLSVQMINKLMLFERGKLLGNSIFVICVAFILFFTLAIIIEIFWLYGVSESSQFSKVVFDLSTYINLAVNLIFVFAVLWIPKKSSYTLP